MASSGLGFMVLLVGLVFSGVLLIQAGVFAIEEVSDAQAEELEYVQETQNQDIDVEFEFEESQGGGDDNSATVTIENTGTEMIDARLLTIVFENSVISLEEESNHGAAYYDPVDVTIAENEYIAERSMIPPAEELVAEYNTNAAEPPEQVRVITDKGISTITSNTD